MCGIMGVVGSPRASELVLDGLRKLEYRGYDSAGIATVDGEQIVLRRKKGKLSELTATLAENPAPGNIAIGHTRWATHGRPSDDNAHPQCVGDIALVHNGIIENFHELREHLLAAGRTFESETDTEVIAHLIALAKEPNLAARVRKALSQVQGAYAIAVISTREPNTIVVAKNASPLVIGVHPQLGLIASDMPALLTHTRQIIVLGEGEMAEVKPGAVALMTLTGEPIARPPRTVDWSPVMAERDGHKHFMHKEIFEQPRAVIDTLRGRIAADDTDVVLDAAMVEACAKTERIMFTACGTSWHAGMVGRLAFEELTGIGCEIEVASELRYRNPLFGPHTLVLAVSQSGETLDTLSAIKEARRRGSPVLSVVNVVESSIARESDWVLYTHAGPEIGVASTKAFVTQVLALALLAVATARLRGSHLERLQGLLRGLRHVPRAIQTVLRDEDKIIQIARKISSARTALYLGRNYGFPVALEGALKLKEISYIHAEGYPAGEMKHGPIALIEKGTPVVVVATQGPVYDKTLSNIQEVKAREGMVIAVATEGDTLIASLADEVIFVPEIDPLLAPLITVVPLQLLAYHVADQRGTDIDQPRNLAKSVTVE